MAADNLERAVLPVLKDANDAFVVMTPEGDLVPREDIENGDGLFNRDTRLISRLALKIGGETLQLKSGNLSRFGTVYEAVLTNRSFKDKKGVIVPEGSLNIQRRAVLWNGRLHQEITLKNLSDSPVSVPLNWEMAADFRDLFETRGVIKREKQGTHHPVLNVKNGLLFSYRGLDDINRYSDIRFSLGPEKLERIAENANHFTGSWEILLQPEQERKLYIKAGYREDRDTVSEDIPCATTFEKALGLANKRIGRFLKHLPKIHSSDPGFNAWWERSVVDMALLTSMQPTGEYPYAGVPLFNAPFGRDGLHAARQMLWQTPSLAKGVLRFLASTQARNHDKSRDAAPGKIVHEIRRGEAAQTGEVPFGRYYGSIDSTPLFVWLAGDYYKATGDLELIEEIWPNIQDALRWMDADGDPDGDGFLKYASDAGLTNKGWKDSRDGVSHVDGNLAKPPVAMCEVQGYAYAARKAGAELAHALGMPACAHGLEEQAERLKQRFNDTFWSEELGTYALALDGQKKPCLVRSSNPGHLLSTGIVPPDRAKRVVANLMTSDSFSGWGIRTLSALEERFRPKGVEAYHNGTVWVWDTALAAYGMMQNGYTQEALQVFQGLYETAAHFPNRRLPELFAGYSRNDPQHPAPEAYASACPIQAWSAGAASLLLQSMLGIHIDGVNERLTVRNPQLPPGIDMLEIKDIPVGKEQTSLHFYQENGRVTVSAEKNAGVEVILIPHATIAPSRHKQILNPPDPS